MAFYKVLKPIILGDRVEAGEIVELSDSEACAFGPEYLEKAVRKSKRKNNSSQEEQSNV